MDTSTDTDVLFRQAHPCQSYTFCNSQDSSYKTDGRHQQRQNKGVRYNLKHQNGAMEMEKFTQKLQEEPHLEKPENGERRDVLRAAQVSLRHTVHLRLRRSRIKKERNTRTYLNGTPPKQARITRSGFSLKCETDKPIDGQRADFANLSTQKKEKWGRLDGR